MIKPENKNKIANITEFCISLLNNMYIMKGGKPLVASLIDPKVQNALFAIYADESLVRHLTIVNRKARLD